MQVRLPRLIPHSLTHTHPHYLLPSRYKYAYCGSPKATMFSSCGCAVQPASTPDSSYPNKDADSDIVRPRGIWVVLWAMHMHTDVLSLHCPLFYPPAALFEWQVATITPGLTLSPLFE